MFLSLCMFRTISFPVSKCVSATCLILHHVCNILQELVDVYVEYPFFVRGQGWSSCSPQRTAHLCGLQCRQLSVGDVCLALTPAPKRPTSANLEPETSPRKSEQVCESLKEPQSQVPTGPQWPAGVQRKEVDVIRRRHQSAPELRRPGTNCM